MFTMVLASGDDEMDVVDSKPSVESGNKDRCVPSNQTTPADKPLKRVVLLASAP